MIDADVLLSVAGDDERVGPGLRELVDAGLLVPTSTADSAAYDFRHALLQEAVYNSLLPHEGW